jgi:hypothetical protein
MAEFSQIEKINIAFKSLLGIQGTWNGNAQDGLQWFNEEYPYQSWVLNDDVIMASIPKAGSLQEAVSNLANNPTIIQEKYIKLSQVPGTNGRAWAAFKTYNEKESGVFDDWLQPQLFGRGYALKLYQDNGTHSDIQSNSGAPGNEIATSGAWIPNYKLGFIMLASGYTAIDLNWTTPLWVKVYRYIGPKNIDGSTVIVSMDNAYHNGHTITVDQGPIIIDPKLGSAPIQINQSTTAPTQNLENGQLALVDGLQYQYYKDVNKWFSINKETISLTARFGCGNYLSCDKFSGTKAGYTLLHKATIIGIAANVGAGALNKKFHLMKNGVWQSILELEMANGKYISHNVNLDFNEGDIIQIYFDPGPQSWSPRVNLELAWRL